VPEIFVRFADGVKRRFVKVSIVLRLIASGIVRSKLRRPASIFATLAKFSLVTASSRSYPKHLPWSPYRRMPHPFLQVDQIAW
jgi:hypothetical protein